MEGDNRPRHPTPLFCPVLDRSKIRRSGFRKWNHVLRTMGFFGLSSSNRAFSSIQQKNPHFDLPRNIRNCYSVKADTTTSLFPPKKLFLLFKYSNLEIFPRIVWERICFSFLRIVSPCQTAKSEEAACCSDRDIEKRTGPSNPKRWAGKQGRRFDK